MKVTYELLDKDSESLMTLEGKEYIAPIGCEVYFSGEQWGDDKKQSYICVEFMSIVTSHSYSINEDTDTLYVYCEIIQDLSKDDLSELRKYNKIKYKQNVN